MPQYRLNSLGPMEFERLSQALLKEVIGSGTITFGQGRDGGREATYTGVAPYPSDRENWAGEWIFQAKFHDTDLIGTDKARREIVRDLDTELDKIVNVQQRACDNYVLITNVPLSPTPETGTVDTINRTVVPRYSHAIKNIAVWGANDVNSLLEKYASVRTAYFHLLVSGDIIAQLLEDKRQKLDDLAITLRAYIQSSYTREQYAQLDQAGDVSDDPVRLQKVFFDLAAQFEFEHLDAALLRESIEKLYAVMSGGGFTSVVMMVQTLLSEQISRVVLVGGPGEGKSTVGQYLAQLHRATLLGQPMQVALNASYVPLAPRLPFRIILRDFGQWLAERRDRDERTHDSLDEYICDLVHRLTSRSINTQELHRVVKENPILLVLDGLDEVTDQGLRKSLMSRVAEFTDRCEHVLRGNLLVLATTRPTGYTEEFDPGRYLHFRLTKLQPDQVRSYVRRWTVAKSLDPAKEDRIIATIDECLADPQVGLLTSTPLQVTILLLIISLGGTPPRQREALFNDYLEIIYKRETAKGRNIIQSEKELLVGLHKYIGYTLHEKVTHAHAMDSVLPVSEHEKHVERFLTWHDPFTSQPARSRELSAITRETGERLVMIVESPVGYFGFELRTIQEFFAACHLADTSIDTEQRYRRFESIARLPHWRNVALFFAGRVGRSYSGEAANIIEVCRSIDREGPDLLIRRGGRLALELAADRAFGPNRRRQRSLLELGLEVLSSNLGASRAHSVIELLQRLPTEDQADLVVPLLKEKVESVDAARLMPILRVLHEIDPRNEALTVGFERLVKGGAETRRLALETALRFDLRTDQARSGIRSSARALGDCGCRSDSCPPRATGVIDCARKSRG